MNAYEYYSEARRVIAIMRREGFADAARDLEDTIRGGATSGEILMGLRWKLDQFLAGKPEGSDILLRRARDLRKRIDAALST